MTSKIIEGDCLSVMQGMESASIDCIVTDPPYGLKFMGKDWDHGIPGTEFWKEALRISKPGAWMLAFGGTRTYHRLTCAIEDSGWEIRDCIMWLYGSGFPKGRGCLKPAYEPIVLARKGGCRVSENFLNIDDCRIPINPTIDDSRLGGNGSWSTDKTASNVYECGFQGKRIFSSPHGRWPANIILDEESGAILDDQTGVLRSGSHSGLLEGESVNAVYGKRKCKNINPFESNSGGASRFFYCAKASSKERNEGLDDLSLKSVSGCFGEFKGDGRGRQTEHTPQKNNHPTVKPIKLMRYLIKLIKTEGVLLDPFCGSGSTMVAAQSLGVKSIGIEINPEYCEIARTRLKND